MLAGLCLLVGLPALAGSAAAAPVDLDAAREDRAAAEGRRQRTQAELDELLSRIYTLDAAREEQAAEVTALDQRATEETERASSARAQIAEQTRQAYKNGASADAVFQMLGGQDVDDINDRVHVLGSLARERQREREVAQNAARRANALAEQLDAATQVLAQQQTELQASRREARSKVAAAQTDVEQADREIAAEEQRRAEEARRRAAAQKRREQQRRVAAAARAEAADTSEPAADPEDEADSGGTQTADAGAAAAVSGGVACPVGQPHNFSDTWGAPRSGGRSHMGVDILAPTGTPIYAYEDGTVTRMNGNSLGGISLYLQGESGTLYYYTHLSGYVGGVDPGDRVAAGDHIAYNGDTGNAAGIPHLHFEVMPGGRGNVNPYPYAARACG